MYIQIVGTSPDDNAFYLPLSSFLINDTLAIDAGSIALGLTKNQQDLIKYILITHVHIDHIATLPLFIDYRMNTENLEPPTIIAVPHNIASIRKHVFNNIIWPDLCTFPGDFIDLKNIDPGSIGSTDEFRFKFFPVNHPVPTYGIVLEEITSHKEIIFTSDTSICETIWSEAEKCKNLCAIFTEISFPDSLKDFAISSGHLTPDLLKSEIRKAPKGVNFYVTHYKPQFSDEILGQTKKLNVSNLHVCQAGERIQFE